MENQKSELTISEAAEAIGKHYITTLRLAHQGYLRAIKKGGAWYVKREEIERFNREGNYIPPDDEEV